MNGVKTYELSKGVNLRLLSTEKFKTNSISVYIHLPLLRETVTKAALIPKILKRGTEKYPTLTELSKKTEDLYGASVSLNVVKKGDSEALRFNVQFVNDVFLTEKITKDAISLLKEIILCPKLEGGCFDKEWVKQEKENLKNLIEGLINDKKEYAQVKCTEAMFEGDPYGIFEYGYVEDLEGINEKNLYEFYKELLKTSVIDIFAGGSFDEAELLDALKEEFKELGGRDAKYTKTKLSKREEDIKVKRITEPMPTSQSKLVMGFNSGVNPTSKSYHAMMLFSCIFGGSPFSKLFNNVREKLSLAYYVFSAADRQKSYMKISAGIEADKFDSAYNEIMLQLDKMKKGEFTDSEIESGKKYLATSIGSFKDSLMALENFYIGQILLGGDETVDGLIESIKEVSRQDIIDAANTVQEDTVYFLKGVASVEV